MRSYKWIAILLVITSLLSCLTVSAFAEQAPQTFSGSRTVVFEVDKSDLDNFVDGGRSTVDLLLRSQSPDWLNYDLSAKERNVSLTLGFSFESLEEYSAKLAQLLTYTPTLVSTDTDGLLLLEGHMTEELLNFLRSMLSSFQAPSEQELSDIFTVTQNSIVVAGQEYSCDLDRLSIRPENDAVIRLSQLRIETVGNDNGSFGCSIVAQVDASENEDVLDTLTKRFRQVGRPEQEELYSSVYQLSLDFDARNQAELLRKLMQCLSVAVSVSEQQTLVDDDTVGVARTEFLDADALMQENASFTWTYRYPTYYGSVTSDAATVTEDTVYAENSSYLVYSYERGFKFSAIDIETAFPAQVGKFTRKITLSAPVNIAAEYHNTIKQQLEARLIRGTVLNIYDNGGSRYYELTYSSWFARDIQKFTAAILGGSPESAFKNSWLPYGESSVQERFNVSRILPHMAPADEITLHYKLPSSTVTRSDSYAVQNGNEVSYSAGNSLSVTLAYRQWNLLKCAIELLALGVLALILALLIKRLKKKRKNKASMPVPAANAAPVSAPEPDASAASTAAPTASTEAPASQNTAPVSSIADEAIPPQPSAQPQIAAPVETPTLNRSAFCSQCGTPVDEPDQKFCSHCGAKLD